MSTETVTCSATAALSADAAWALTRSFAANWHPLIASMELQAGPRGALVRAFTVHGEDTLYREQLIYFSDTDREYAYCHLQGIDGVDDYRGRFSITPVDATDTPDAQHCVITMQAEISAPGERAAAIATGTHGIFQTGLEALCRQLKSASAGGSATSNAQHLSASPVLPAKSAGTGPSVRVLDGDPELALLTSDAAADASLATTQSADTVCLFLHGIGGNSSNWHAQLDDLPAGVTAAALDLRGYGNSALGRRTSTVDDYCNDILRVCDELGAARLVLCGLSYGAWIATSFATRYPERLTGLVLSGGCTGMSEAPAEVRDAFLRSREVPLNEGKTPADFADAVLAVIAGPAASDEVRRQLRESMAAISPATYRDALHCFTHPPEQFDFARLTMPVLMLTGAHDQLAPPAEIRGVAARISAASASSDVRFEVIDSAGHVCNLEAPGAYNALLSEFVARVLS